MIVDFNDLRPIGELRLAAIMRHAGAQPVMFSCLLPGIDLIIWQKRPNVRDSQDEELMRAALKALDHAVEFTAPGAVVYDLDGYSFFAFRVEYREEIMLEMGLDTLEPLT